ncbi:MAG: D-aminoacyl-tRNA deacylase [Candidatus Cloacimonadales bacterium]|jgi:D-tyrosyl-tRNA(Tyr) deacylase|nr:D-tyrosyl-tRNA(Tyr) deacylase [Candidatus Cloacimonadota bacterium]MDD2650502.1 D-aminoacyl-tRNA deacylase [Candidatus Cloacimonadota bacterium]MDD3501705.1 D-aminoacyl-tRNA deacylase [Candidatus Cloacimonadota bacterium]MDX9976647.1 D-aminoacyl-tRNA deacylase [Candidatus Cloacimonadales bacterium]
MKALIQRVSEASVTVDGRIISSIDKGLLVLLGIHHDDKDEHIDWLTSKIINLRIFEDNEGKMNLSLNDINGEILLVSQFTLYANCDRGRRPDFIQSAKPDFANDMYERFAKKLKSIGIPVKLGIFGADMKVALINDGPVTIMLEK